MTVKIFWHGDPPPPELITQTETELAELLEGGLSVPEDLITHSVLVDGEPRVAVWGVDGDSRFHAEYTPDGTWVMME